MQCRYCAKGSFVTAIAYKNRGTVPLGRVTEHILLMSNVTNSQKELGRERINVFTPLKFLYKTSLRVFEVYFNSTGSNVLACISHHHILMHHWTIRRLLCACLIRSTITATNDLIYLRTVCIFPLVVL